MTSAKTSLEKLTTEKDYLTTVLQSTLADNHKLKDKAEDIPTQSEDSISDDVKEKTLEEPTSIASEKSFESRCSLKESETCSRLLNENKRLRAELLELESEMIGARLDNVYLDKELAGRIQQIQLLLASNTPTDTKEKMWGQIESEMCLQRSKTIAQMCKTKQVNLHASKLNN